MIRVKVFDESHEKDLEESINSFLKKMGEDKLIDIKYQVAICNNDEENQIYCFTAMVIYKA
ncbi:sporulation protein Cse60 [Bacillus sp. 165]|uniref:sporulation protein Cse60 n=1 Tax=Bacillus sp. 165 TaxID=1529117 RepID=UPI001ADA5ED0|nr:sporulation protein Cse60 [Bacillus sp. 165]